MQILLEKANLRILTGWWSGWNFCTIDLEFLTSGRDFWNKSVKKVNIGEILPLSRAPQVKTDTCPVNWQMMAGSQTGTIRLLGDFCSGSSSRGNVTDDNSSSRIRQLASAKSYGDQLDLCQPHLWRPFIRLLCSKRSDDSARVGDSCWITAPTSQRQSGWESHCYQTKGSY